MSDDDRPLGPAEADAEAVASAESVQEIYAALAPELLDAEALPPDDDVVSDAMLAGQRVHVVLVTHDGSRWLPRTLSALGRVDGPVASVTAVDTGSRDDSADLLDQSPVVSSVVRAAADTWFPAAVARAVSAVPAPATPSDGSTGAEHEWLWLLHDDSAPHPHSLRWLLHAAAEHDAAVVGPKVLDWEGRRLLVELGLSITGAGRRDTGLEGREFDQGQHDDRRDVLAVGTAGMLVRRDAWDVLDGLDPQIDLFRDDVDFGWRANLAGYRVVVEPRAVIEHAAASSLGRRRLAATAHRGPLTDRRNAVHVLLANTSRWAFLPVLLRVVVGSLLRSLSFVAGKVPDLAWDEAVAVAGALRPARLREARRWRRSQPRTGSVRGLRPSLGTQARHAIDNASAVLSGRASGQDVPAGHRRSLADEPLVARVPEDESRSAGWLSRLWSRPGVWMVALSTLLVLFAARTILVGGRLQGGALLPAPDSGADWWASYLAGWHPVGLGSGEGSPPFVAVLAGMSLPLLGSASGVVTLLVLGCVPLAMASSWWALRGLRLALAVRLWAAATYGVLVLGTGAMAAGRLGTCVTAVLAPFGVRAIAAALRAGAPARHAWRAALLVALATAFTPVVWPIAVVVTVVAAVVVRRSAATLMRVAVIALAPAALLLPWLPTLAARPAMLVGEVGLTGRGGELSDPSLAAVSPVLLAPGGPGSVPAGLLLAVPLLALLALASSRSAVVRLGWLLALVATGAAVVTSRVAVSNPVGEGTAAGWPGPSVVLAGLGMLVAIVTGLDLPALWEARRPVAAAVVAAGVATTATVGIVALASSVTDPLDRGDASTLPTYVAEESAGPDQVRTLVLRSAGAGRADAVEFTVTSSTPAALGDAEVLDPRGGELLAPVVGDVVAGRGEASAGSLAAFGIRYLFVPDADDRWVVESLDGQPGLVRASAPESGAIWRVEGTTARVRLLTPGESSDQPVGVIVESGATDVSATIDTPAADRVVVADLDDAGWTATLDGEPLTQQTHADGLLAFELPTGTGELRIEHRDPVRPWLLAAQAVAVLVAVVAMVPPLRGRRESLEESLL